MDAKNIKITAGRKARNRKKLPINKHATTKIVV